MQGTGDDKRMRRAPDAWPAPGHFQNQPLEDGTPVRLFSMIACGLAGMIVGLVGGGQISFASAVFVALTAGAATGWVARGCGK